MQATSRSETQRGRTLTLPRLTARYLEYIRDVQRVLGERYGSPKLIICIDELDKITDPEQIGDILREIKGALYERNCFYLLSISEDAVRAFENRLVGQRDIFESTFDEILVLERLDLDTSVALVRERCRDAGAGPSDKLTASVFESIEIAAVLSTGVPREILRNLRNLQNEVGGVLGLEPARAWYSLFRSKLRSVLEQVRSAAGLEALRADLIDELERLLGEKAESFDRKTVQHILAEVRDRASKLQDKGAELQEQVSTSEIDSQRVQLEYCAEQTRTWARDWRELEIHLLVRQFSNSGDASATRTQNYRQLLAIYSLLPYSLEAAARRLSKLRDASKPQAA